MTAVYEVGDGPALVLLHAFPCDGRMWEPQAHAAAEAGWRVLVPDLPGFGTAPLRDADPSLDPVADHVLSVLDERDVVRAVVGGVSLGGYVAMAMVRRRPSVLAGLILCDTKSSADGDEARANRERLAQACLGSPDRTGRILEQSLLPGLLGPSTHAHRPDVVDRVRGWLHGAPAASVAWYQRAMAGRPDSRDDLAALDAPTLVVWGEEDALSPRDEQERMAEAVSDARIVTVAAAGHLANVECPELVSNAIVEFLDVVKGPRTS